MDFTKLNCSAIKNRLLKQGKDTTDWIKIFVSNMSHKQHIKYFHNSVTRK